jgi:phospholipid transport system substrate-binding protein
MKLSKTLPKLAALVLLGFFATPVQAADLVAVTAAKPASSNEQIALDFVKDTAEKGLTFLSRPNSTEDEKKAEFKKLLNNSFDMESIGRFTLGRYWNVATPAQQTEYQALFRKMIVNVYAERFGDYKGQKFEVRSSRPVGNDDVLVSSFIVPTDGSDNVQVDWRVRNRGGALKIVDVLVAGVSMTVTQRSDFSSVIQRGGGKLDVLIDYLKQKS